MLKSLYKLRETPLPFTSAICTKSTPLAALSIIGLYLPLALASATKSKSLSLILSFFTVAATPEACAISGKAGALKSSASRGASGSGVSGITGLSGLISVMLTPVVLLILPSAPIV